MYRDEQRLTTGTRASRIGRMRRTCSRPHPFRMEPDTVTVTPSMSTTVLIGRTSHHLGRHRPAAQLASWGWNPKRKPKPRFRPNGSVHSSA